MKSERTSGAVQRALLCRDSEDLKKFDVPTLIMHGDDDQIVPIGAAGLLSAKIVKNAKLKVYHDFPHGMCTTKADQINADLLAFLKTYQTRECATKKETVRSRSGGRCFCCSFCCSRSLQLPQPVATRESPSDRNTTQRMSILLPAICIRSSRGPP